MSQTLDVSEFWNTKGLQDQVANIQGLEHLNLWQRLNFFMYIFYAVEKGSGVQSTLFAKRTYESLDFLHFLGAFGGFFETMHFLRGIFLHHFALILMFGPNRRKIVVFWVLITDTITATDN